MAGTSHLIEHEPNVIAPGHGRPFLANREKLLATGQKMRKQDELFRGIVADPDVNGLDPGWCRLYPYQMQVRPGVAAAARAPGPAIAADVVSDGRYLGQITEAVVEMETT